MMVLVQDTKRPNKDPFEISEEGFKGLQKEFGERYQSMKKIIVTPEKLTVKLNKGLRTPANTR